MKRKYPVVTLCGSTRFKEDFIQTQKKMTLEGYIVISVGLFGHSGDEEVWENMNEDTMTATKLMLDDMHKAKIDLSDGIYVVNPNGYIGHSTWSEICYASMTGKRIDALEPIEPQRIEMMVSEHIRKAEELAAGQYDVYSHLASGYPENYFFDTMVTISHKRYVTVDPWVPMDNDVPTVDVPYPCHGEKESGFDPFAIYGKKEMARFVETILMKEEAACPDEKI